MKTYFRLLLFSLFIQSCNLEKVDAPFVAIPTDGLVAYYKFSGNAHDKTNFANHGDLFGVQFVKDHHDNDLNAVYFNGINNYIKVPHTGVINFGKNQNYTISIWVKYSSQDDLGSVENDILAKWENNQADPLSWPYPFSIRVTNQTTNDPGVWFTGRWDGSCSNGSGCDGLRADDNIWHHIAVVKNTTVIVTYQDGVEISTKPDFSLCETGNNSPLFIGARRLNERLFKGCVDDLRIYNRDLSNQDIIALSKE